MLFNSIPFLLFFIVVFLLYWLVGKNSVKVQNLTLLLASWFFYGFTNLKMLLLFIALTIAYYYIGLAIEKAYDKSDTKKAERIGGRWTTLGVLLGVGALLYFKYFNFFIDSFIQLLNLCGLHAGFHSLNIIMPLGISFFTFRLLAYVLDVNHGKVHAEKDFVKFAVYVSFFPCILSGPIDRPQFIKQLHKRRVFEYEMLSSAVMQFIWGLFKKVVVADNCATYVNLVWENMSSVSASTLLLAAFLYAFELYADFSGYSDMAIAVGKGLGLKVADNFHTPFYALNIADFWRRWHMSLTQWMTDYVFMPLNLTWRKWGKAGMILAIVINFLIVGLWHGDSWIYAIYGLYHGLLFVPLILSGAFFKNEQIQTYSRIDIPKIKDFGRMFLTFMLVVLGFIMFRAETLGQFAQYLTGLFDSSILSFPLFISGTKRTLFFVVVMMVVEWIFRDNYKQTVAYRPLYELPVVARVCVYYLFIFCILEYAGDAQNFIYFQF